MAGGRALAKENAFLAAVWEGNISIVDKLMREGIQPNHLKDEEGRSAYDLAAERKDQQMMQLLQEHEYPDHQIAPNTVEKVNSVNMIRILWDASLVIIVLAAILFFIVAGVIEQI